MVVIHRLAEVTNHPILQGAVPNNLVRVCRNEDRRDRVACIDEVSVEFDARSFQASGRRSPSRWFQAEEAIPRNRPPTGTLRQCSPATSRVFSWNSRKGWSSSTIEINLGFGIAASGSFSAPLRAPPNAPPCIATRYISEGSRQSNGRAPKRWLMPLGYRLRYGMGCSCRRIVSRLKAILAGRSRSL